MKLKFDFEFVDLDNKIIEGANKANKALAAWLVSTPSQIVSANTALDWARSLQKGEDIDLTTEYQDKLRSFLKELSQREIPPLYVGQIEEHISLEQSKKSK